MLFVLSSSTYASVPTNWVGVLSQVSGCMTGVTNGTAPDTWGILRYVNWFACANHVHRECGKGMGQEGREEGMGREEGKAKGRRAVGIDLN